MKKSVFLLGFLGAVCFLISIYLFRGGRWPFFPTYQTGAAGQITDAMQKVEAVAITVKESGLVGVTLEALGGLVDAEQLSADFLQLTYLGEERPFFVDDKTLYFYGVANSNKLIAPARYLLQARAGRAMAMAKTELDVVGAEKTIGRFRWHYEQDARFVPFVDEGDPWLGESIWASKEVIIPFEGVRPIAQDGQLVARLWSNNEDKVDPDHHLQLFFNDQLLGEHYWDGITSQIVTMTIGAALWREEGNQLRLFAPGDTGAVGEANDLDWVELHYSAELQATSLPMTFTADQTTISIDKTTQPLWVFDVTDEANPIWIEAKWDEERQMLLFTGQGAEHRYLVTAAQLALKPDLQYLPTWAQPLNAAGRGADYLAIIPEQAPFKEALSPLLSWRRENDGYQVATVSAEQIYHEYGYGQADPAAIRAFIHEALQTWKPAPRFVLLVGDASYDLYDIERGEQRNWLPTPLIFTEFAGWVATDTWLATTESSFAPQVAIGRFPVQTSEQLKTLVEKTVQYEQQSAEAWQRRTLLVADDELEFSLASDAIATLLQENRYINQKLYMLENEQIREAIIGAINQGVGWINYVGHGSLRVWGDERVLQVEDATALQNSDRLAIFTTFTCLNGYFNHPQEITLVEALLWHEGGGIVAAVAPSGRSLTSQQMPLAEGFYRLVASGEVNTLGEALQRAKSAEANNPLLADILHTFNLLGDPALTLK